MLVKALKINWSVQIGNQTIFNVMLGPLGTALGCAMRVKEGAVPNEHGTWLYGRGGWCDGLQVNPWRVDVTKQVGSSPPSFSFHPLKYLRNARLKAPLNMKPTTKPS